MQDEYSMETPWEISAAGFPQHGPADDQLRFLLRYAILAPSTRNTQPWKFRVRGDAVEIFADPGRWLKIADQNQRELYLSIGCALENLLIAARHFGFAPQVDYLPDPGNSGLAARVVLGRTAATPVAAEDLFAALLDRQTTTAALPAPRCPSRTSSVCKPAAQNQASPSCSPVTCSYARGSTGWRCVRISCSSPTPITSMS